MQTDYLLFIYFQERIYWTDCREYPYYPPTFFLSFFFFLAWRLLTFDWRDKHRWFAPRRTFFARLHDACNSQRQEGETSISTWKEICINHMKRSFNSHVPFSFLKRLGFVFRHWGKREVISHITVSFFHDCILRRFQTLIVIKHVNAEVTVKGRRKCFHLDPLFCIFDSFNCIISHRPSSPIQYLLSDKSQLCTQTFNFHFYLEKKNMLKWDFNIWEA